MKNAEKKKISKKKVSVIVSVIILLLGVSSAVSTKIFMHKDDKKKAKAAGNDSKYDIEQVEVLTGSPLEGKNIVFLGSSVTYGAASMGTSFADYIGKRDGVNVIKEAVSATTLVDEWSYYAFMGYENGDSYIKRMKKIDTDRKVDCFVCQLSTNDATMKKELGEIADGSDGTLFDTHTITGAMEYIIWYVRETWGCPVVFYTGSYYESEEYAAMVERLLELQEKWDIGVVDLYTDTEFNDIDPSTYELYMYDKIHPTKAGYLEWWMPRIEEGLYESLK